ncbi:MAG TPA: SCO family protein [Solirubrobacteraceae bacterium]|nr:SCO family protein [Solirubrobacteraceae bacterium]
MRRARILLPAGLSVLVLIALVVALVATKGSSTEKPASSTVAPAVATTTETTVAAQGGFDGAALPGSHPAPDFSLDDQYGRHLSLASLRGAPVLLAFLYSGCGAPCVLIAQQIRGALDELGSHPIPVVIVSADPAGDTPVAVRRFLAEVSLSGRVYYLTGSDAQLHRIWSAYDVHPAAAGRATFAKYATVRLLDSRGRERVVYGSEQLTPDALAHDAAKLAGGASNP